MTCYSVATAQVSFGGNVVSGQAPVNKVGALLLADGLAVMSANAIEIQGKGPNGPKQTQLKGKIFKISQTANGVKAHVYFDQGPGLSALDSVNCNDEYVKMTDGTKVSGPISDVADNAITCARRAIPMNEVAEVHSPRVFKLNSSLGDKPHLNLEPTCIKAVATTKVQPKSTSSGGVPVAGLLIGGCLIAAAIAIPLAVAIPLGYQTHINHLNNNRNHNKQIYGPNGTLFKTIFHVKSSSSLQSSSGP